MASCSQVVLLVLAVSSFCWGESTAAVTVPTADLLHWSSLELGAMISWNIDTMDGIQGCQSSLTSLPDPSLFDGAKGVNFESWARIMQAAGVKYSVLTVKHGCGFTLWEPKVVNITGLPHYNYSIAANHFFFGRNLVDEYYSAMKKYGIRPGFYYSLGSNAYLGVYGGKVTPNGTVPLPGQVLLSEEEYYELVYQHIEELATTYPDMYEFWFDGGVPPYAQAKLAKLFAVKIPHVVAFQGFGLTKNVIRWPGTESGHPTQEMWSTTDSYGDPSPNGTYWYPGECDTTVQFGDQWFYNGHGWARSLDELKDVYHDSVGNNCNLMLNFAPDSSGNVHYEQTYRSFGDFVEMCYPSNAKYYPAYARTPPLKDNTSFFLQSEATTLIDRLVLMETQTKGECILSYDVFVYHKEELVFFSSGKWIAHKRILLLPKPFEMDTVQVRVNKHHDNCIPAMELIAATQCDYYQPY